MTSWHLEKGNLEELMKCKLELELFLTRMFERTQEPDFLEVLNEIKELNVKSDIGHIYAAFTNALTVLLDYDKWFEEQKTILTQKLAKAASVDMFELHIRPNNTFNAFLKG